MPLVDVRGYQLTPDIVNNLQQGMMQGEQYRAMRAQRDQREQQAQIREMLGQAGQAQPMTQQQQMLAAQEAEMVGEGAAPTPEAQPQITSQESMIQKAKAIDPIYAQKVMASMGIDDASKRAEASRFAASIQGLPEAEQNQMIQQRVEKLKSQGRDPSDTSQLLEMDPASRSQALENVQLMEMSAAQRATFNLKQNELAQKKQLAQLKSMENAQKKETNALKKQELQQKINEKKDKAQALKLEKTKQAQSEYDTMTDTMATIDRAINNPSLETVVGWNKGLVVPGSKAATAKAHIETLKSQAFLSQVKNMKGMGALSENEGKKLAAALGALEYDMPYSDFKKELERIRGILDRNRTTMASYLKDDPTVEYARLNMSSGEQVAEAKPEAKPEQVANATQSAAPQKVGRFTVEVVK